MRPLLTLTILTLFAALSATAAGALTCVDLKCEFLTDPLGVDREQPRLSWRVESDSRGQSYIAYRILAASSPEKLAANEGDLWDSGRQDNVVLLYPRYGGQDRKGKPLVSGQVVHWKVMVWDASANVGEWSAPARFTMALTDVREWKAQWISFKDTSPLPRTANPLHLPAPRYYRKEFEPKKKVKRALAYATALGIYELHLNGEKVGDAYFAPGWTDYRERIYYNTHDVTDRLAEGANCLGAVVADGWYAGYVGFAKLHGYGPNKSGRNIYGKTPALSVQLWIEFEDGTSETIVTDPAWKTATGPEYEADLLMGEAYDAGKEMPGWSAPGFDDSGWEGAVSADSNPAVKALFVDRHGRKSADLGFVAPALMEAYPAPPVRVTQELGAKAVSEPKPGTWIFDFGQNFAGIVRLHVMGAAGQKITLRYGEMLHPDGTLMTENLREARATDTYICKGSPDGETWTPRFTYHGFRYAELTGLPEKPAPDTLTGLVLHNDMAFTSGFECSDPVVNKIYQNCVWTQRANSVELPTGCSQRDERLGWTGEAQLTMSAGCYDLDARAFFGKWLRELQACRTTEGYYASYAPYPFGHGTAVHGTAWSDAGLISPFVLWRMYGEREVIQDRWFAIERYVRARLNADPDLKGARFGAAWGDANHLDDPTPIEFIDLCYAGLDTRLMMEMAKVTGGPITFNKYRPVLVRILESFQKEHLNPDGSLKVKSQTGHVLPLRFGLIPGEHQRRVVEDLVGLIRSKRSATHSGMTTGVLGTRSLLTVLSQEGHHDEAVRLIQSRKFPSWGHEIENGATTLWERFDAYSKEDGFKGPLGKHEAASNAFSHRAHSFLSEWMLSSLAGIAAQSPGFEDIILEPGVPTQNAVDGVEPISWVRAHYDSARGRIAAHWKAGDDGGLLYEVTLPAHTRALLKLPAAEGAAILESGKPVAEAAEHVAPVEGEGVVPEGQKWFVLASGSYRFEVK